jgi:hypothetical protein
MALCGWGEDDSVMGRDWLRESKVERNDQSSLIGLITIMGSDQLEASKFIVQEI